MNEYRFPAGFVWGAGTSAAQIEGSPLADGAKPSIIHRWAHTPGNTESETDDVTCDHYNRADSDVAVMAELGLHAYQFSIGWGRVLPDGTGEVNAAGLDFYDRLVDKLLEAGVQPFPILHVWDLPGALQDRGGWANRESADWFGEFAAAVFDRLGDRVRDWLTICETHVISHYGYISAESPPCMRDLYAGMRAVHHLLLGHGRAVEALRASHGDSRIGTSAMVADVIPATDSEADLAAAGRVDAYLNYLHIDPIMKGEYPAEITKRFDYAWPPIEDGDMEVISTPVDFLGYTYYLGFEVADKVGPDAERDRKPSVVELMLDAQISRVKGAATALDWPVHPRGVYRTLTRLSERYARPPIVVTENGAVYHDTVTSDGRVHDEERLDFIRDHLVAAHQALEDGVDLRGWFVWSLIDMWEFWLGFKSRFGLVHVDYATQARTIKDSGLWYREVMSANGFEHD